MNATGHASEDQRFAALKAEPDPPPPQDSSVRPLTRQGDLVMLSGIAFCLTQLLATGRLGDDVSREVGPDCAWQCTVSLLARLQDRLGSPADVEQPLRLTVFVASAPRFREQHLVAIAASQVLVDVLATGPHARAALGVPELPLGSSAAVEAEVSVHAQV